MGAHPDPVLAGTERRRARAQKLAPCGEARAAEVAGWIADGETSEPAEEATARDEEWQVTMGSV